MKNLTKIFMAVVAGMFAFSCVTDTTMDSTPTFENEVGGVKTVLSVGIADSEELRTQLGAWGETGYPMYWSNGDQISVNGVASNELSLGEGVKTAAAEFGFGTSLNTPYCVAYPAAAEGQVKFAAAQSHAGNSTFGNNAAAMWGYSEDGEGVQLNHLTGVLKIGVVADEALVGKKLTYAQVSTIDRAPIAGDFEFDFAKGELGEPTASATEVISYSFGEGVELSAEPTYLHIAVPAGKYEELYVTLYDVDGGVMYATVKAGDSKPLTAGKVREFKKDGVEQLIKYAPTAEVFVVRDAATLSAFAAKVKEDASFAKDVLLVNDIDMAGTEWTPIEGYASTVLGNGYAIKNLSAPLFGETSASFKGLHLQVNMSSNNRARFGALACYIKATDTATPTVDHCTVSGTVTIKNTEGVDITAAANDTDLNFGGIIGRADGVKITDTENKATINVEQMVSSSTNTIRGLVGGLVGHANAFVKSDKTIVPTKYIDVVNSGDINYNATTEADKKVGARVGGISGTISGGTNNNKCVFENCTNTGDITVHSTDCDVDNYCAGICPVFYGGITNCVNRGDVKISGTCVTAYLSGVVAYVNNGDTVKEYKWTGCANYGKVSYETATIENYMHLGGLGARIVNVGIDDCHNYGELYASTDSSFRFINCGGVAAYLETKTEDEVLYMTGCTNNAPINFWASTPATATSTYDKYMYRIGGLTGYNNARVDSCTNNENGDISIKGSITQLYFNPSDLGARVGCEVAGCLAYKSGKIATNITNYGDVTFDATLNHLSTIDGDLYLAGCMGITTFSAEQQNFKNYGKITVGANSDITVTRAHIAGVLGDAVSHGAHTTVGAANEGSVVVNGTITTVAPVMKKSDNTTLVLNEEYIAIGGIRGAGRVKKSVCNGVDGDGTKGSITISGTLDSTLIGIGGLVGYGNCIGDNINYGKISTTSTASFKGNTCIAGLVGMGQIWNGNLNDEDKTLTNIKNYGDLEINGSCAKGTVSGSGELCVAGVAADFKDKEFKNAEKAVSKSQWYNYGNISVDVTPSMTVLVGGVGVYLADGKNDLKQLYNNGNISVNNRVDNQNVRIGGVTYRAMSHFEDAENNGNITFTGKVYEMSIGGVIGADNNWNRKNLTNNGAITVEKVTSAKSHIYLGGICYLFATGNTWAWENCHNTGKIWSKSDVVSVKNLTIGGLMPYAPVDQTDATKAEVFKNCSNSGDIVCEGKYRRPYIGGLFGFLEYTTSGSKCPRLILENCSNSGNITVSTIGNASDDATAYVGGIIGRINECWTSYQKDGETITWSGTIKNSGNLKYNGKIYTGDKKVYMGGIVGRVAKATNNGNYLPVADNLQYINTGNITYEHNAVDLPLTADGLNAHTYYIGGIVGETGASPIANATVNCTITAIGTGSKGNIGMIFGQSRTDVRKATNCQVAGSIDKGVKKTVVHPVTKVETTTWVSDSKTLNASNFHNYIYSAAVDASVATGDGCTCPTPAPTTQAQ